MPPNPQPQVIIVPNGGGGGGLATRLGGAILASLPHPAHVGYFATYTTLASRVSWLRKEGVTGVEMPAETKGKRSGVVERSRGVLGDTIGRSRSKLAKTKESTTGGIEKAKETVTGGMAKATKKVCIYRQGDRTQSGYEGGKAEAHVGAIRQEESRKKHEEQAKQFRR